MTRYARAGNKGTHQRVAKDSTSWDELKPPPPQRLRGSNGEETWNRSSGPRPMKRERFNRNRGEEVSSNFVPIAAKNKNVAEGETGTKKSRNDKVRGFGQSKSVLLFGQFWVPYEDGKRFKKLSHKLKEQGLSKKEILEALKNDRRKAEKSSKRQRDKICFQCRQFGHILSDCPNLKGAIASSGNDEHIEGTSEEVCFKCGSTEHTSRRCRKNVKCRLNSYTAHCAMNCDATPSLSEGDTFEFAKCFICSGSGHIARQCPQNTNGIYTSGGSCGECGSINHLKKDCPDFMGIQDASGQKEDNDAVTLRMSDPFLSTEYEPIPTEETEKADEAIGSAGSDEMKEPPRMGKRQQPAKKKSKKRKDDDNAAIEFDFASAPAPTQPQVPKKRKIVKF